MSGFQLDTTYLGWKSAGGSVPAAPTGVDKSVVDFSGGSTIKITVASSTGLTGAKLKRGATTYALASFAIFDGTHVTGVTPGGMTASATACDVIVSNSSGDSPALSASVEVFDTGNITGLQIDVQADRGVSQTSGYIDTITDHSGNGHDATGVVGGAGHKPAFVASGINGRPSWQGTAYDEYFTIAGVEAGFLSSVHAFLIQAGNGNTEPPASVGQEAWNFGTGPGGFADYVDGNIYDNFGSSARPGSTGGAGAHPDMSQPHVLEVSYPTASPTTTRIVKVSGTTVITEAGCTPGWSSSSLSQNFLLRSLGGGYRGIQSGFVVYDHQLTSGERARFAAWVLDKWGITI